MKLAPTAAPTDPSSKLSSSLAGGSTAGDGKPKKKLLLKKKGGKKPKKGGLGAVKKTGAQKANFDEIAGPCCLHTQPSLSLAARVSGGLIEAASLHPEGLRSCHATAPDTRLPPLNSPVAEEEGNPHEAEARVMNVRLFCADTIFSVVDVVPSVHRCRASEW